VWKNAEFVEQSVRTWEDKRMKTTWTKIGTGRTEKMWRKRKNGKVVDFSVWKNAKERKLVKNCQEKCLSAAGLIFRYFH
jgi:hypothetical protein